MAQIDVSQWRPFVIGDYFTLTKGKRLTRADMIPGKYRFIGASGINNGVTAEVANDEFLHTASPCHITVQSEKRSIKTNRSLPRMT